MFVKIFSKIIKKKKGLNKRLIFFLFFFYVMYLIFDNIGIIIDDILHKCITLQAMAFKEHCSVKTT